MRSLIVGIALALTATVAFAAQYAMKPLPNPDSKADMLKLFSGARHAVHPSVTTESYDNAFVFAVVGSTRAAGGTYFHSEVTIANNSLTRDQKVQIFYLPSGSSGCAGIQQKSYTFKANTWWTWEDLVAEEFNTSGLGSAVVFAVTANNDLDTLGNIDGCSRIWTPAPGMAVGTVSQSFPAVALDFAPGPKHTWGLHQDSQFRTNVFVLNYLPDAPWVTRTFTVSANGLNHPNTSRYTVDVAPCSLGYLAIPNSDYGAMYVGVDPPDSDGGWYAFGSTVDQFTSDNWSCAARVVK